MARFNGPDLSLWREWQAPSSDDVNWYFTAELNHDVDGDYYKTRKLFCKAHNLKSAIIFYDTVSLVIRIIAARRCSTPPSFCTRYSYQALTQNSGSPCPQG